MNLFSLAKKFPTEEHALAYWMKTRWPNGVLIETKDKTGKPARLFECADCGLHFSATTGTLFHDSHLPLQKMVYGNSPNDRREEGNLSQPSQEAHRSDLKPDATPKLS
jgi:hypothetical protein